MSLKTSFIWSSTVRFERSVPPGAVARAYTASFAANLRGLAPRDVLPNFASAESDAAFSEPLKSMPESDTFNAPTAAVAPLIDSPSGVSQSADFSSLTALSIASASAFSPFLLTRMRAASPPIRFCASSTSASAALASAAVLAFVAHLPSALNAVNSSSSTRTTPSCSFASWCSFRNFALPPTTG